MCVLVLAVGACSLLGAEQCLHVASGDSGTWQWALPSHTVPAPGALGSAHLLPGPCPVLLAGSQWGFQRGFSTSAAGSSGNVCQECRGFYVPNSPNSLLSQGFTLRN